MENLSEKHKSNNANTLLAPVYSQDEVKSIIQAICRTTIKNAHNT